MQENQPGQNPGKRTMTRDHFFPRSMGFTLEGNVVLACRQCNHKKRNSLPSHEEIAKFANIWNQIKGGPCIDLSEFIEYQKAIDFLHGLVGPVVYVKNVI